MYHSIIIKIGIEVDILRNHNINQLEFGHYTQYITRRPDPTKSLISILQFFSSIPIHIHLK